MQTLDLDDNNPIVCRKPFWRRQFQDEPTDSQKKCDWAFGVILPVICFMFDPLVFKGDLWGTAMLGAYKPFAYILSFVSVMSMFAWLVWRERLKWLNAFLAGLFIISGLISLAIGIVLFPFSLFGLLLLIGALGFTPLFSSIVYLRNARRAYRAAKPFIETKTAIYSFGLAAILSFVIPFVVNTEVAKSMDAIKVGDERTFQTETQKLRYLAPLVNFDLLALDYHRTPNEERQTRRMKAIAEFYKEMTGNDMENSAWVLMD